MTTPTERTRALLQTRDLLRSLALSHKTGVPPQLKADAEHLLRHFPTALDILTLADACPSVLVQPSKPML